MSGEATGAFTLLYHLGGNGDVSRDGGCGGCAMCICG